MKAIRIQKRKGSNQESLARYCTFSTLQNLLTRYLFKQKIGKKELLTNGI